MEDGIVFFIIRMHSTMENGALSNGEFELPLWFDTKQLEAKFKTMLEDHKIVVVFIQWSWRDM